MIRQYPKSDNLSLSPHFTLKEFHCRCTNKDCLVTFVSEDLINALEDLRRVAGGILVIADGFRCQKHNSAVSGVVGSKHLFGIASDIHHPKPRMLAGCAKRVSAFADGGIGIYDWGIHCDVRGTPARWDFSTSD